MKQWTYTRTEITGHRCRYFNCPAVIVYAETIVQADKQFEALTGLKAFKLPHVGVSWFDVTHVGVPDEQETIA